MACQLVIDLHGCDDQIIDNMDQIRKIAHEAIQSIHAEIVEECMHRFLPIGISYIAVITTSHFSIHTWPEYRYAAVDIFSCDERVPQEIADFLQTALKAEKAKIRELERKIQE